MGGYSIVQHTPSRGREMRFLERFLNYRRAAAGPGMSFSIREPTVSSALKPNSRSAAALKERKIPVSSMVTTLSAMLAMTPLRFYSLSRSAFEALLYPRRRVSAPYSNAPI